MEEIKMARKNVTIHIIGSADYIEEEVGEVDFDQLVKIYFKNNKFKLHEIFNTVGDIKANSVLRNFQFDSVSKDIT
jgi:hypothetical protein